MSEGREHHEIHAALRQRDLASAGLATGPSSRFSLVSSSETLPSWLRSPPERAGWRRRGRIWAPGDTVAAPTMKGPSLALGLAAALPAGGTCSWGRSVGTAWQKASAVPGHLGPNGPSYAHSREAELPGSGEHPPRPARPPPRSKQLPHPGSQGAPLWRIQSWLLPSLVSGPSSRTPSSGRGEWVPHPPVPGAFGKPGPVPIAVHHRGRQPARAMPSAASAFSEGGGQRGRAGCPAGGSQAGHVPARSRASGLR